MIQPHPYDPARFVSYDVETYAITPGNVAPPLVCAAVCRTGHKPTLHGDDEALDLFRQFVESDKWIMVGANIAYDLLVCAVEWAKRGVNLVESIFDKYDRGEVFDILIAEALHAVGCGHLNKDPRTGAAMTYPNGGKISKRYAQDIVADHVLGVENAKEHDEWKLRYGELADIPLEDWPESARVYPCDDVRFALDIACAQVRGRPYHDMASTVAPNLNLHDLPRQAKTAWVQHLGAAWGVLVDKERMTALEKRVEKSRIENLGFFIEQGFFKLDEHGLPVITKSGRESENKVAIKRMIVEAYGGMGTCARCKGSGTVPGKNPKKPNICKGADGGCDGTGFDLDEGDVPRTDKGGVKTDRDVKIESGDERLMRFGYFGEDDRIGHTYLKFLRKGFDEDGRPIPIGLKPNVLLANGRSSYSDVIQLIPRRGGVRECIVPRPGHVFYSIDYASGEMVTHAQSCLNILGWSKLADAMRNGIKPHNLFAAGMLGIYYEDFNARLNHEKNLQDQRQAAKKANFGFPGGMAELTFVLRNRAEDFVTKGPDGTEYKGIRFCLLIGGEEACGVEKIHEYKGHPCRPVCKRCVAVAKNLRNAWFRQWPENRDYFKHVAKIVDSGAPIVQHVSNRIRGGVGFCDGANTFFSGLLADVMKDAHCRVVREERCDKSSALYGSRCILVLHDELIGEAPIDRAHEVASRVSEIMVEVFREHCPDMASACKAEPALMERWYKGAEGVYDSSGRLVPWKPEER